MGMRTSWRCGLSSGKSQCDNAAQGCRGTGGYVPDHEPA